MFLMSEVPLYTGVNARALPVRTALQGCLAHKKQRPPRTLQQDYAWGPIVVRGGGAVSYERGTPVRRSGRITWGDTFAGWPLALVESLHHSCPITLNIELNDVLGDSYPHERTGESRPREIGILLPNNQRQHRTSHTPKDVLPLCICAHNCAPCQPLLRAFSGWIRSPPPAPRKRCMPPRSCRCEGQPSRRRTILPA